MRNYFLKLAILSVLVLGLTCNVWCAPLYYDEAVDGDFPLGDLIELTLDAGDNLIIGNLSGGIGLDDDFDQFFFTIPTGFVLTSWTAEISTEYTLEDATNPDPELWFSHAVVDETGGAEFFGTGDVDLSISGVTDWFNVDPLATPLESATYGYWDARHSYFNAKTFSTDYIFTLTVEPMSVPEPATLLLLGTGLIGLAGFRRKFRK